MVTGSEQAFFGGGCKYHEQVKNHSKIAFSVMFCVSAAGDMLPPMTVFKSANSVVYKSWCEGGEDGAAYSATKSGWFDMERFNQWFREVFLVWIRRMPRDEIKVLLGDNLAAHLSPYVLEKCAKHNVRFCFLPENSTHLLQPLDVAVFAPMKKEWRKVLSQWKDACAKAGENYSTIPKQVKHLFFTGTGTGIKPKTANLCKRF